ncbi:lymphocyte antigen 86 isoform 2 precursor [Mus musculus]|uniref:lymphocyte antigen 86 isoform 2 precursor n=1 Tax=Mus musculus TaxID=10090 RepID=UPI002A765DE6|nr:lymphocyte antigen 86 isoform 2 precursor [Mus musculus]
MNGVAAALLVWILTSPSSSDHGSENGWPKHTACNSGGLEVVYQSCDPLQDFGLSIDQCSKQIQSNLNIRFGIILRQDIRKLFLDITLMAKGSSILNYSYPLCEEDQPKFSFCGRRKGEQIYYAGPVNNPGLDVPQNISSCWNCTMKTVLLWLVPMPLSPPPEHGLQGNAQ